MKIIDLLNKIANGEIKEISKFIYKGDLYEQESNFEEFGNRKGYVCRRENGITLTTLDTLFDIHKLNDEVEVIEDNKKIEKISWKEKESLAGFIRNDNDKLDILARRTEKLKKSLNEIIEVLNDKN